MPEPEEKKPIDSAFSAALPIQWIFPENQHGIFANHAIVQFDTHEFHLSFFEVRPPVLLGSDEQKQSILEQMDVIEAKCVARIVISRDRMPGVLKMIADNVERHIGADSDEQNK